MSKNCFAFHRERFEQNETNKISRLGFRHMCVSANNHHIYTPVYTKELNIDHYFDFCIVFFLNEASLYVFISLL